MRVTVIVPEALMTAANHTHVILGKSSDVHTYTAANWQDGQGNLYAVSSGVWTDAQIAGVTNPAVLQGIVEAGEVPEAVDLTLVQQAQAAFSLVHMADDEGNTNAAPSLAGIVAIPSDNPHAALAWLGLTRIPEAIE